MPAFRRIRERISSGIYILISVTAITCSGQTADVPDSVSFLPDQSQLPVAPPDDAVVLLDTHGPNLFVGMDGGPMNWPLKDGVLESTRGNRRSNHLVSQLHFRDADIHVEFMLPEDSSGNSGIYLHGNYELQIFNSTGKKELGQEDIGAIYGFHKPLVNAGREPGAWQAYDIRYRAPRRDAQGKIVQMGSVTAYLNGVIVQDHATFGKPRSQYHPYRYGTTPYLQTIWERQKKTMTGPVFLQDHDAPVRFRNVWVRPLDDQAFVYTAEPEAPSEFRWLETAGQSVGLKLNDAVLWQFNYGPQAPKPHFHPVSLRDGTVVTEDTPEDHPWHNALWFSWKFINNVNYWEFDRATGKSEGLTKWDKVEVVKGDDFSAQIRLQVTYQPNHTDSEPVLIEERTINVRPDADTGACQFDWKSRFTAQTDIKLDRTPLPNEPHGKAWGGYAGLSVRLTHALQDAHILTCDGPQDFDSQSRFRGRSSAMDFHGVVNGKPIGIAILDHSQNLNSPTPWYAIRDQGIPFYYFSPAVIAQGPVQFNRGAEFTLRYRILPHEGSWTKQQLNDAIRSWN